MSIASKKSSVFQCLITVSLLVSLTACGTSKTDDRDPAGMAKMGDELRNHGDDVGAAEFYQRTLETKPDDAKTRLKLAELLEAHGDNARAAIQYETLLQNDADDGELHRDLGRVLIKQGKASDARAEYEKALSIDSDDIRAMNGLGIALDYLGNHEAAQKVYKEALDEKSDDLASLNNLAHSYVLTGAYNQAIALLEPYVKDKGATAALRQNLAEAYGMEGMEVDAERVGRMDLSPEQVKHNLAYYRSRRAQLSVAPKFYADLGSFVTEAMAQGRVEHIKALLSTEAQGVVISITPQVKSIGGTPSFGLRAVGFTRVDKVRVFCDKLKKQNIACTAHG